MKIVWSHRALGQLRAISAYIAEHNPAAAMSIRDRIRTGINQLRDFPLSGRAGRVAETRELVISGAPYLAAYRQRGDRIEILAILHAAREWPEDF